MVLFKKGRERQKLTCVFIHTEQTVTLSRIFEVMHLRLDNHHLKNVSPLQRKRAVGSEGHGLNFSLCACETQSLLASLPLPFYLNSAGLNLYESVNPNFTFWKGGLFPKTNTFLRQQFLTYK